MIMSHHIYYRMLGYVATIALHILNGVLIVGKMSADVELNEEIIFYQSMQLRFFTIWTLSLQLVYSVLGLTCDIMTLRNKHRKDSTLLKRLKNFRLTLFAGVQWPSNWLVFVTFWSVCAIDCQMILPSIADIVISPTSNHIMHTLIIPIVVWELVFHPRSVPKSHVRNVMHVVVHISLYLTVLMYTYYSTGRWLYPVFGVLYGTIYFYPYVASFLVIMLIAYFLQWPITRYLHGNTMKLKQKPL